MLPRELAEPLEKVAGRIGPPSPLVDYEVEVLPCLTTDEAALVLRRSVASQSLEDEGGPKILGGPIWIFFEAVSSSLGLATPREKRLSEVQTERTRASPRGPTKGPGGGAETSCGAASFVLSHTFPLYRLRSSVSAC